eukprot:TRINITY_DN16298_c0_g1_i1.p1 TRINITY_DN16298_c0_g1~~TRINITY_DN16298_c0_g1_i1.p1  ORF type:complete len:645 (+),score=86.51 TRINITY_DN16298_c0_g1_i1:27-1937(+)
MEGQWSADRSLELARHLETELGKERQQVRQLQRVLTERDEQLRALQQRSREDQKLIARLREEKRFCVQQYLTLKRQTPTVPRAHTTKQQQLEDALMRKENEIEELRLRLEATSARTGPEEVRNSAEQRQTSEVAAAELRNERTLTGMLARVQSLILLLHDDDLNGAEEQLKREAELRQRAEAEQPHRAAPQQRGAFEAYQTLRNTAMHAAFDRASQSIICLRRSARTGLSPPLRSSSPSPLPADTNLAGPQPVVSGSPQRIANVARPQPRAISIPTAAPLWGTSPEMMAPVVEHIPVNLQPTADLHLVHHHVPPPNFPQFTYGVGSAFAPATPSSSGVSPHSSYTSRPVRSPTLSSSPSTPAFDGSYAPSDDEERQPTGPPPPDANPAYKFTHRPSSDVSNLRLDASALGLSSDDDERIRNTGRRASPRPPKVARPPELRGSPGGPPPGPASALALVPQSPSLPITSSVDFSLTTHPTATSLSFSSSLLHGPRPPSPTRQFVSALAATIPTTNRLFHEHIVPEAYAQEVLRTVVEPPTQRDGFPTSTSMSSFTLTPGSNGAAECDRGNPRGDSSAGSPTATATSELSPCRSEQPLQPHDLLRLTGGISSEASSPASGARKQLMFPPLPAASNTDEH